MNQFPMQRDLSFKIYSDGRLSEIAAAVTDEEVETINGDYEIDAEFKFAVGDSPVGINFPLFETDLLSIREQALISKKNSESESEVQSRVELSFRDLFINDRDQVQSDSSSDEDELDRLPSENHCVWMPPASASLKSGSSRSSSLRWKLKNFLHRSNSDGSWKDNLGYLIPKPREHKMEKSSFQTNGERKPVGRSASALEELYVRSRLTKEIQKKKSFLPYRQSVLGLFSFSNRRR